MFILNVLVLIYCSLDPPEITPEKAWVHTSPGLRAELTCIVAAEPHAQVKYGSRYSLILPKYKPIWIFILETVELYYFELELLSYMLKMK
jgi:hypothetical protein